MQIAKWGNSLAIRIPADVARNLNLIVGDNVDLLALEDDQLAVVTDRQRRNVALKALRSLRGTAPQGFKFNREEANER